MGVFGLTNELPLTGFYFFIKSRLSGYVVTAQFNDRPGSPVIMWPAKSPINQAQLFYEDFQTGTIRNMVNNYCLEAQGSELILNPYHQGNSNQKWLIQGKVIHNRSNPVLVLDILNNNKDVGAKVGCWNFNGGLNQQWAIDRGYPQYFCLIQKLVKKKLCIDKADADKSRLIFSDKDRLVEDDRDLWYQDRFGVVRSKHKALALDSTGGPNSEMTCCVYSPSVYQKQWVIQDGMLVNKHVPKLVVTVQDLTAQGPCLFGRENKGADSQMWEIVYKEGG